jgi:hypothetical protein
MCGGNLKKYHTTYFLWWGIPPRYGHFVYPPLKVKSWTRATRPRHKDQVSHRFATGCGPNELVALKGIQTLDLMEITTKSKAFTTWANPLRLSIRLIFNYINLEKSRTTWDFQITDNIEHILANLQRDKDESIL